MAGADRAVNMALRTTGLDGVKRDLKAVGSAGDQAFGEVGKAAEAAYRKSEKALQKMRDARAQAEAIAKTNFDGKANSATPAFQSARKNFVLGQLQTAKSGIAAEAKAAGVQAEALAAGAARAGVAVDGMGAALGVMGLAAGVAAGLVGGLVAVAAAVVKATDEEATAQSRFEAALKLSGAAAGLTAAQVESLAQRTANATGQTEDAILRAGGAIANLPGITSDAFNQILPLAAQLADVLGTDVATEAEKMGAVMSDIATGDVAALEKAIANLDPTLQATIISLTEAGRTADAQKAYLDALGQAADGPTGLSTAVANLTNKFTGMLAEWGRASGIAASVNSAIDSIGASLDWLKGKAGSAAPIVSNAIGNALNPLGGLGGIAGGVKNYFWPGKGNVAGGKPTPAAPRGDPNAARVGLADRATANELRDARLTTKEKQKQSDTERLTLRYRQAGLSATVAAARAEKVAGDLANARAEAAARNKTPRASRGGRGGRAVNPDIAINRGIRNQEAFDSQLEQLNGQILGSRRSAATDEAVAAQFARDQVETEAKKTADLIDSRVKLKQYTTAQGDELKLKVTELKNAKLAAIDTDLRQRQARNAVELADAANDNQRELLRGELSLATTNTARARIAQQLLANDYDRERRDLAAITVENGSSKTDEDIAKAKLKILGRLEGADRAATALQYQTPLQAYFAGIPQTIDEIGEAMERVRVDKLDKLVSRTKDFADGLANAGGKFASSIARFENPLTALKTLLSDLASQFTKTFVEEPVTDFLRSKTGGLAEKLVGKGKVNAGDYGLSQQAQNAATKQSTTDLIAFSLALKQAQAALLAQGATGAVSGGGGGLLGTLLNVAKSAAGSISGGELSEANALLGSASGYGAVNAKLFHTGSGSAARRMVPAAMFDNAPRLHTGTLSRDEFAAVLKRDEDVLTGSQSAALREFMGGGGRRANGGGDVHNYVTNINSPQPANPRRIAAVVGRSQQLRAGRQNRKGLAAGRYS